jgi:hypothetical protein
VSAEYTWGAEAPSVCHHRGCGQQLYTPSNMLAHRRDVHGEVHPADAPDAEREPVAPKLVVVPGPTTENKHVAPDHDCVVVVRASDVQDVALEWDDYPRLARGIFTLYEGAPEQGKTLLQCDSAATYTRRGQNVIIHADEDSYALTWKPRLRAAGADLAKVFLVTAARDREGTVVPFYLSDDGERLARKVRELDAGRVFFDSLVSTMGTRTGRRVDSHNDLAVRQALRPLTDLGCGVSAIRHFKKARGTDAANAGGGSVAFFAVARVVLAVVPDPNDPGRHLLAISKNNLVPSEDKVTLAYRIVPSDDDPKVPRISWEGVSEVTANDALEAMAEAETEARGGARAEAKAFLSDALKDGQPVRSEELIRQAAAKGISERTLWRAKAQMKNIRARKTSGAWCWYLTTGNSV